MNKFKKLLTITAILAIASSSIFAQVNLDLAMNYDSKTEDDNGDIIDNEYPFSFTLLPSFSKGDFYLELRAPLSFGLNDNSISFDTSMYDQIEREDDESNISFATRNISHYLSFVNYLKYGQDWDDFNFTFGTIRNATIGDGALIYHYRDSDFVAYERKAGLKFKLDGNLINLGFAGVEGISNDLFNSDFYGGRVFVRPLHLSSSPLLKETELGLTLINYNSTIEVNSVDEDILYQSLALDINQLLHETDHSSISVYYDIISEKNFDDDGEAETDRSLSWRVGFNGRYFSSMSYNVYFKSITDDSVEDLGSNVGDNLTQLLSQGALPTIDGDFNVYGTTGIYSLNDNNYLLAYSEFDWIDYVLNTYTVGMKYKSNSSFLMLNNLKLEAYKTFNLENNSTTMKETFFEGITSLKNVALSLQSDVQYGINVFNVGLLLESDDEGEFNSTYKISYRISLF